MENLSALLFPDTDPAVHVIAKLLVFFKTMSYYLPTEADADEGQTDITFKGLCKGYAPAPLGQDLPRFRHLLRDLERSRPEEFSRLFSTAKTPIATGEVRDRDEMTSSGVYTALQQDSAVKTGTVEKERLWQARLILKLAEVLERKEAEVRMGLAHISTAEQNLFTAIEGHNGEEAEDQLRLTGRAESLRTDTIRSVEQVYATSSALNHLRLRAWVQLYLADKTGQNPALLVTPNVESGAVLIDGFENIRRRTPLQLFSLPIPAGKFMDHAVTDSSFIPARTAFRKAVRPELEFFADLLRCIASGNGQTSTPQAKLSETAENIASWQEKLQAHFPDPANKAGQLDFYCFPGVTWDELLQRLFRLEGIAGATRAKKGDALLAVLNSS